ncbi:hypothetical protein BH23ACT6_BH23ACT6_14760 [soil metagenome]
MRPSTSGWLNGAPSAITRPRRSDSSPVIPGNRHPEAERDQIVADVVQVLTGEQMPDERTGALIALVQGSGLTRTAELPARSGEGMARYGFQSSRPAASSPMVVESPCPVFTVVSDGRVSKRSVIEATIVS